MKKNIILHNPQFDKKENIKVSNLIKTNYISSQSHEVIEFEKKIKIYTRNKYCFATINGTSALHLALASLDVQKDDEVIVPSLTFIATINSIRYVGANPIFFDNDKDFIINITEVIKFLKENTFTKNIKKTKYTFNRKTKKVIKAIIIVHPFGFATDISKLIKICKSKNIKVVEDVAEALGVFLKKNNKKIHVGSQGDIGCLSFNANKIISSGGGGAIITNNRSIYNKIKYLGTTAKDDGIFFKHNKTGYNYRMSGLHASVGIAQLKKIQKFIKIKEIIHNNYINLFEKNKYFILCKYPDYIQSNYWLNIIILKRSIKYIHFKEIIMKMNNLGIFIRPLWYPNHLQEAYKICEKYNLKKVNKLIKKSILLPSGVDINYKDQKYVYESINKLMTKYYED